MSSKIAPDSSLPLSLLLGLFLSIAGGGGGCSCGGPSGTDAGVDSGVDAGPDAGDSGFDAGTDAGPDAGDAGSDAGTDAGPAAFEILHVTPARGQSAGGERITLSGVGFVAPFAQVGEDVESRTAVLFGSNTAIDFTIIDDDTLEVIAPPGLLGPRDVVVQNPNGEARCVGCYTYYTPVRANALVPAEAPIAGGIAVTLTGQGFTPDTQVLLGDQGVIALSVVDEGTLSFSVPAVAAPMVVDLQVFNPNGRARLRRAFRYFRSAAVERLNPAVGPAAGQTIVQLQGRGLSGTTGVLFDGLPGSGLSILDDGQLVVSTPPGTSGSVVNVLLQHPRGDLLLAAAFAYIDPNQQQLSLLLVQPARGPVGGGERIQLLGTGLDRPAPQVSFGSQPGLAPQPVDANRLDVTTPAFPAVGSYEVSVRNDRGGANLSAAYTAYEPLVLSSVSPAKGPVAGGTDISVIGSGFAAGMTLRVGAMPVTGLVVQSPTALTATTAAGSPGLADLVATLGGGSAKLEGRLTAAFEYERPLLLSRLEPARGSQAGGTQVLLLGAGFTDQSSVLFGSRSASVLSRVGDAQLLVRSPAGAPGLVSVRVSEGGQTQTLSDAFLYYDPTNLRGGASGGPMAGTINITVMDSISGLPLENALVQLGADPASPFQGLTDLHGQITFSDASLVKALDVTANAEGHQSVTVSRVNTRDLTVYLTPNAGSPGNPPSSPPPSFVGGDGADGSLGRVCGFKLPPSRVLQAGEHEEARVYISSRSSFSLPPFGFDPGYQTVSEDCGTFTMPSRAGNVAVYAMYGLAATQVDPSTGQTIDSFEPILMGVTRGLEVPAISPPFCTPNQGCPGGFDCSKTTWDPENPAEFGYCLCQVNEACSSDQFCNQAGGCQPPLQADVILSVHLDLDVPIRLVNAPQSTLGPLNLTYSYLELGGEGTIYIGSVQNSSDRFDFPRHPRLPGDGFVFLDLATSGGGYPLSLYFRRQVGDLSLGVDLGPMQPLTHFISPVPGGALSGTRVQWSIDGTPMPDIVQLDIEEPGFVPKPLWTVILPGSETSVEVPPTVLEILRQSPALQITLTSALSPRFDFDHFSYNQLSALSWNSFTLDAQSFVVP